MPESTAKIAKFRFDDLCGKPLSAADYLEITKTFGTVFLLDVPKMGLDSKDKVLGNYLCLTELSTDNCGCQQARRFITFIDGVYLISLS